MDHVVHRVENTRTDIHTAEHSGAVYLELQPMERTHTRTGKKCEEEGAAEKTGVD